MTGETTETPATPPPTPPPVVAPPDPQATLTTTLLGRLADAERRASEFEAKERAREAEAARLEQDRLAEKGNADAAREALEAARATHAKEIEAERGQRAEAERRGRISFRDRELATTLAGRDLVPGAAAQLIRLLKDDLTAEPEGEGYTVRTKDFVSVSDYVARKLADPEYAHFLKPSTTGGVEKPGVNRPADPEKPLTPEQQRVAKLRGVYEQSHGNAPGLAGTYN